jgi:hypothetical protein
MIAGGNTSLHLDACFHLCSNEIESAAICDDHPEKDSRCEFFGIA